MTMSKKKRTALAQQIRALVSEIEAISQHDWEQLVNTGRHPDDRLLLSRNALKALKEEHRRWKGSE
jgi:hypothetical protein